MVEQGKGITQELALLNTLTGGDYSRQVESYTNLFSCITRCPWGSCAERTQTYLCQTKHGNEPPVSGHIPKIIWTIKVPPCEATFNKTEQKRSVLLPALSGVWDNRSLPPSLILRHQNQNSDVANIRTFLVTCKHFASFLMFLKGNRHKSFHFCSERKHCSFSISIINCLCTSGVHAGVSHWAHGGTVPLCVWLRG